MAKTLLTNEIARICAGNIVKDGPFILVSQRNDRPPQVIMPPGMEDEDIIACIIGLYRHVGLEVPSSLRHQWSGALASARHAALKERNSHV